MTDKLREFNWQFYNAIDEASLNFDFDELSEEDQKKAIETMKAYIEEYFLSK